MVVAKGGHDGGARYKLLEGSGNWPLWTWWRDYASLHVGWSFLIGVFEYAALMWCGTEYSDNLTRNLELRERASGYSLYCAVQ